MMKPKKFIPRKPHYGLTEPKRVVDPEEISLLNVTISDGNIQDIKNIINDKKLRLDVKDSEGNTPIHYVLTTENQNITMKDRLEIIKFLHNNGSPIDTFNNKNITPLHLAISLPSLEIVNYLLKYNVDLNRRDNNSMTPLMYSTQGKTIECKEKKISKPISKIVGFDDNKNIQETILSILETPHFSVWIDYIHNQLLDSHKINLKKTLDFRREYINDISNIAVDSKLTKEQKKKLKEEKVLELKQQIYNRIKSNLSLTLSELEIGFFQNGWSPTSTTPKVIKDVDYLNNIDNIDEKIRNTNNSINVNIRDLTSNINEMFNKILPTHEYQQNIIQHAENFIINDKYVNEISDMKNSLKLNFTDPSDEYLKNVEVDNKNSINYNDKILDNINIKTPPITVGDVDRVVKTLSSKSKYLSNKGVTIEQLPLSYDWGYTVVGPNTKDAVKYANSLALPGHVLANTYQPDPNSIFQPSYDMYGNLIYDGLTNRTLDDDLTHISDIMYFLYRILYQYDALVNNIDNMFKFLLYDDKGNRFYNIIYKDYIPIIITNIVNIIQNLLAIKHRLNDKIDFYTKHKNTFETVFRKNINRPHAYSLENAIEYLNLIIEPLKKISDIINNTYNNLNNIHSNLNNIIRIINRYSGLKQTESYFKKGTDEKTEPIINIFKYSLDTLINLPSSLIDYQKKIKFEVLDSDINTVIKNIIIHYYPQVSPDNPSTFIGSSTIPNSLLGVDKYLINIFPDPTTGDYKEAINIDYGTVYNSRTGILAPFPITNINEDDINYNGMGIDNKLSLTNNIKSNNIVNPYNPITKRAITGFLDIPLLEHNMPKNEKLYPSIKSILDEHINHIKYSIVKNILGLFSDTSYKQNGSGVLLLNDPNIINKINEVKEETKKKLIEAYDINIEYEKVIFHLVATLTSKLIENYIENKIDESAYSATKIIMSDYTETYKDIFSKFDAIIGKLNKKNILRLPIDNYELDLSNIRENILDELVHEYEYENKNIKSSLIANTNLLKKFNEPKNEYSAPDIGYSRTDTVSSKCLKIDLKLIEKLLQSGANPNLFNKEKLTPIHYAIQNNMYELVELLINNGAKVSTNSVKNKMGKTPLQSIIDGLGESIMDMKLFYSDSIKKIEKGLTGNIEFKNNVIQHIDTGFKQIFYMLNHHMFFMSKKYPKEWSYDDYKKMCSSMVKSTNSKNVLSVPCNSDRISLLSLTPEQLKKTFEYNTFLQPLNSHKEKLKNKLEKLRNKKSDYNKSLKDIQSEHDDEDINDIAKVSLAGQIRRLTSEINIIDNDITDIENRLNKLEKNINDGLTSTSNDIINNLEYFVVNFDINQYKDIVDVYKHIFNKVINSVSVYDDEFKYTGVEDFKGYNELWEVFINSEKTKSIENIVPSTIKLINNISEYPIDNREVINIVSKLYNNVLNPFAKDYIELSQEELSENYALKIISKIISHTVRHVICASMYISIIRATASYILTVTPEIDSSPSEKRDYVRDQINKIFSTDGLIVPKLCNYIVGYLPKILTRHILNIRYDSLDEVNNIDDISQLINPIIDILKDNDTFTLNDDSELINTIKDKIFPYYTEILTLCIPQYKIAIDNFMRFISNKSEQLKITELIIEKSMNEI